MSLQPDTLQQSVQMIREHLPELQALFLFGSEASGQAHADSDIDLAVLLPVPLPAQRRWELAELVASRLGCDVDLVDLRSASTVMQYQVVAHGQRLWSHGTVADEFELTVLSEYWDLQILRRELIEDIQRRGRIHGG